MCRLMNRYLKITGIDIRLIEHWYQKKVFIYPISSKCYEKELSLFINVIAVFCCALFLGRDFVLRLRPHFHSHTIWYNCKKMSRKVRLIMNYILCVILPGFSCTNFLWSLKWSPSKYILRGLKIEDDQIITFQRTFCSLFRFCYYLHYC